MGKKSPTTNLSVKKKTLVTPDVTTDPVLRLMERLSEMLIAFRKREGYDQKQMADLMNIGQSRYNEIEKLRNLNPEFGVSVAFLMRFAELEKTTLGHIVEEIQEKKESLKVKKKNSEELFFQAFSGVKLNEKELLCTAKNKQVETTVIPDRVKWLVELGLDLFSMETKEQLEFEMGIHQLLLKEKGKGRLSQDQRRTRLTAIMRELILIS